MLRRDLLRASAAIGVTGIAGCTGQSTTSEFTEGFGNGLGAWVTQASIGPEEDLAGFEWEIDISGTETAEGDRSLRVWNEGDYDDGVTWASHSIAVESGRACQIEATGQFWSESESFNTIRHAVMRLGPEPAEVEDDFPQLGVNSTELGETPFGGLREPLWLSDGWRDSGACSGRRRIRSSGGSPEDSEVASTGEDADGKQPHIEYVTLEKI